MYAVIYYENIVYMEFDTVFSFRHQGGLGTYSQRIRRTTIWGIL
jgi:hypothetical protein